MTSALQQVSPNGHAGGTAAPPGPVLDRPTRRGKKSWFSDPSWPIVALLAGWPLWWILGTEDYIIIVLAIPMVRRMYRWRANRERVILVPPGFGFWLLFLLVATAGIMTISLAAPDTIASPVSHRIISWAMRFFSYLAFTVLLLYAGNLTEQELPRRRLAWLLGLVGIYAVIGGVAGLIAPGLRFTSPLAALVPQSIQLGNGQLQAMLHPALSEVQAFLGYAEGRPQAPFDYTNMWGNCLAILLPWLVVAWWSYGTRRQRWAVVGVLAVAFAPAVYSLDRGLWVGIGCALVYLAVRYAARGRLAMLGTLCGVVVLVALVIAATPLQGFIGQRLAHGESNNGRLSLSKTAAVDAAASPILGYGDTRHQQNMGASIAVGRNATVGGNGQLWMLLITTGLLGTGLYIAFFGYGAWRFRRDTTPYGMAGVLVLLLGFVFMFVYQAIGPVLDFTMLAYVLLWKNDREMRRQNAARVEADEHIAVGTRTRASLPVGRG